MAVSWLKKRKKGNRAVSDEDILEWRELPKDFYIPGDRSDWCISPECILNKYYKDLRAPFPPQKHSAGGPNHLMECFFDIQRKFDLIVQTRCGIIFL